MTHAYKKHARFINIAGNDPVVGLIVSPRRNRFAAWLMGACVIILMPVLWAAKEGNFRNDQIHLDAFHDVGYWNQAALVLFMVWFMRYYFSGLERALRELREHHIVQKSSAEWDAFVDDANAVFTRWWVTWTPVFLAASIMVLGYIVFLGAGRGNWNSPPSNALTSVVVWLSLPPVFLVYLVLGQFLTRVACLWSLIKLFMRDEARVHVNPLHPDGAGGLAPLGTFSLRIVPACLVGGLCTLLGIFANTKQHTLPFRHPVDLLIIFGYVFALSIVFFLPLYAARGQMKKAKAFVLGRIGEQCNRTVFDAVDHIAGEPSEMQKRLATIENLQKLYAVADNMPIYPFDAKTVCRFVTSVAWPVVVWISSHAYAMFGPRLVAWVSG